MRCFPAVSCFEMGAGYTRGVEAAFAATADVRLIPRHEARGVMSESIAAVCEWIATEHAADLRRELEAARAERLGPMLEGYARALSELGERPGVSGEDPASR